MSALEVLAAGVQTTVQDRGRPGLARIGVGVSGASDRGAHALANRLVGNPPGAAALEVLLGGLELHASEPVWIAVTGAVGAVELDGCAAPLGMPVRMPAGAILRLTPADHGIRYSLAVRGGIDVPPALGSRSRDTLAALGPDPLADGDRLPIGPEPASPVPSVDAVPLGWPPDGAVELGTSAGPRRERFDDGAWAALLAGPFTVSSRSDRSGIRLDGPPLPPRDRSELPSEGMVPGAIQVSPDGAVTILGPDAPVTGGYPVIAVVADRDLDRTAQVRPGQPLRFVERAVR